jgi:cytochrome P450
MWLTEQLSTLKTNQYIRDLKTLSAVSGMRATFPTLTKVVTYLPLPFVKQGIRVGQRMKQYAKQSLERHYRIVEEEGESAKPTLLSKLYKAGSEGMSFPEVRDNAVSYIIAGSDTTVRLPLFCLHHLPLVTLSIDPHMWLEMRRRRRNRRTFRLNPSTQANTLTYLVWLVCRHNDVKDKLLRELQTLPDDFDYDQTKSLPYLNNVIEETLRLYSAAPAGLPRVVPQGGAEVRGHFIPEGYTVSAQAYSMHRIPEVFPDPLAFKPERWESPTSVMKESMVPFGGGSRSEWPFIPLVHYVVYFTHGLRPKTLKIRLLKGRSG